MFSIKKVTEVTAVPEKKPEEEITPTVEIKMEPEKHFDKMQ